MGCKVFLIYLVIKNEFFSFKNVYYHSNIKFKINLIFKLIKINQDKNGTKNDTIKIHSTKR